MSAIRLERFETQSLPVHERIARFETYLKGSSKVAVNDCEKVLLRPYSSINPNVVRHERWIADDLTLAATETSGFIMTAETRIPRTSIIVSLMNRGEFDLRLPTQTHSFKQGDICISTAESDYQISMSDCEVARIYLPHGTFPDLPENRSNLAVLRRTNPMADILGATYGRMFTELRKGNHEHLSWMSNIVREMIHAILLAERGTTDQDSYTLLRIRACAFIDNNLAYPDLNIDDIADHVNASRSTLYRAFKELGGVRDYITNTRLDAARQILEARGLRRGVVLDAAYSCGFSSTGSFFRAFKRRFGCSPSEYGFISATKHRARNGTFPIERTDLMDSRFGIRVVD